MNNVTECWHLFMVWICRCCTATPGYTWYDWQRACLPDQSQLVIGVSSGAGRWSSWELRRVVAHCLGAAAAWVREWWATGASMRQEFPSQTLDEARNYEILRFQWNIVQEFHSYNISSIVRFLLSERKWIQFVCCMLQFPPKQTFFVKHIWWLRLW